MIQGRGSGTNKSPEAGKNSVSSNESQKTNVAQAAKKCNMAQKQGGGQIMLGSVDLGDELGFYCKGGRSSGKQQHYLVLKSYSVTRT